MSNLFADYAPEGPRRELPADLVVRRAGLRDVQAITRLLVERNGWEPGITAKRTEHGVSQPSDASFYGVAETGGEVVAFARAGRYAPPEDAPANAAPAGWYLLGLAVDPAHRRRGVARALTVWRLGRIAENAGPAGEAYYFASASNRASVDLHAALGFAELSRDFWFPAVDFERSDGMLFRLRPLAAFRLP